MHTHHTRANGERDARGRRRSIATTPGFGVGRVPGSKGRTYPPHPFETPDLARLLEGCRPQPGRALREDEERAALRLRALIVVMWRSGLRISEALALEERDLNPRDRTVTVRRGKGGKRRIVAMDDWAWNEIERWLDVRRHLRPGAVFCVLAGPTEGKAIHDSDVRRAMNRAGRRGGLRRRCNPRCATEPGGLQVRDGHDRRLAAAHGLEQLSRVQAAQVQRRDVQARVAELLLDHGLGHPFAPELHGERVAQ